MKMVELGQISKLIMGQAPPGEDCNKDGNGIPFVKAGQFGEVFPIIDEWTTRPLKKACINDVLICVVGATAGKINCGADCAIGRSVAAVRPLLNHLDRKYLYYFLSTWTNRLRSGSQGSAQKVITRAMLQKLQIPLPPLEEQKRIAAILDLADSIRRKRKEAIKLTEELLRSVFLDMFGDPVTNPKGWEVVPMKSVVLETQYGTSLKANNNRKGLPILRMNNITYTGEIALNDIKWGDIPVEDEEKYTTKRGDLLFNRTNSPELVGKTAVWRSNEKYAIAGYLVRVRFKNDKAVSEYVSAYLNSSYGKKYLYEKAKPSINMSNFSASEFVKIPLMLPSLQIQKKFELFSHTVRASIINLENALNESNILFNSLLQRAFRGEL